MRALWAEPGVGDVLVKQALHQAFLKKNKLPPGAESPYLLTAGVNNEGEADITAIPLVHSPTNSAAPLTALPRNGNR
jgi:hypothetical protein